MWCMSLQVCVCVSYSMFVENYRDLIDKDMGGASPRRAAALILLLRLPSRPRGYLYALLFTGDAAISLPLVHGSSNIIHAQPHLATRALVCRSCLFSDLAANIGADCRPPFMQCFRAS